MRMVRYILMIFMIPLLLESQILIDATESGVPDSLVYRYMQGKGARISNVSFKGSSIPGYESIGLFDGTHTTLGISSGIIMSTGNVRDAFPYYKIYSMTTRFNTSGDPDIEKMVNKKTDGINYLRTFDGQALEFDFRPDHSKLKINYIFASEEYEEFVCSFFNDAFAIYVSGPGIYGKKNIALIPTTKEFVAINTLNNGCYDIDTTDNNTCGDMNHYQPCEPSNPEFFISDSLNSQIEYDGYTKVLTASVSNLIPGGLYHFKIALCDVEDSRWDSALLLDYNSFGTEPSITFIHDCFDSTYYFNYDLDKVPSQTKWDFGDGSYSTEKAPSHSYSNPGLYSVTLIAEYNDGSDPDTLTETIAVTELKADFTYDMIKQPVPLFKFYDKSIVNYDNIVDWQWDFGDGTSDSVKNPWHTYSRRGSYRVRLIVTNQEGCKDTVYKQVHDFYNTFQFTENCIGYPVIFTVKSSWNDYDVQWDFADSTTSTEKSPEHIFTKGGSYDVKLLVTNKSIGVTDTVYRTVFARYARAGFDYKIGGGTSPTVEFFDRSYSFGSVISNWSWEFGTGSISYEQNPVYKYQSKGKYRVRQIVTDKNGCTDTLIKDIEIRANVLNVISGCYGDSTYFSYYSSWDSTSAKWYTGDGGEYDTSSFSHRYDTTGIYDVRLIVTNPGNNDIDTAETSIIIDRAVAGFDFTTGPGADPEIFFNDRSYSEFGTITDYYWDFGDGASSTFSNPPHKYASPGNYQVKLIVKSNYGCRDSIIQNIDIESVTNKILAQPSCAAEEIGFSYQTVWDADITTWDFGDGVNSQEPEPTHEYTEGGDYIIKLILQDTKNGKADTLSETLSIPGIKAAFNYESGTGGIPQVKFYDASEAINDTIRFRDWDFGDGGVSTEKDPVHMYAQPGKYEVTLTVESGKGCHDSIKILINDLKNELQYFGKCAGETVTFDVMSSWSDAEVLWDFGDGDSSTERSPEHIYSDGGDYLVKACLESQKYASRDTLDTLINISSVKTDFDYILDASGAKPKVDFLNKSISKNTDISEWHWDFGDNAHSSEENPSHEYDEFSIRKIKLTALTSDGCMDTVVKEIPLFGKAYAELYMPDTCVNTGDRFNLPLLMRDISYLDLSGNYKYRAKIRFNKNVLLPLAPTPDCITEGDYCTVTLEGDRTNAQVYSDGGLVLDWLHFIALLGDTDNIKIEIRSFEWLDGMESDVKTNDSHFCISNICPAGGKRFYHQGGKVDIINVFPNPAEDVLNINYEVVGDGYTEMYITDMPGRRVKTLVEGSLLPGRYELKTDIKDLPGGSYILTLRTASAIIARRLELIR